MERPVIIYEAACSCDAEQDGNNNVNDAGQWATEGPTLVSLQLGWAGSRAQGEGRGSLWSPD